MTTISLEQFSADPSGLLARVTAGETVIVTRGDKPVAEVRPVEDARPKGTEYLEEPRPMGLCKGEFVVPDDFDDPLPGEILRDFEGG
ncbi:MAG: type II toxin-antitoxin system Phd/YefM family antitoxin [Planctomycetota bacterium]